MKDISDRILQCSRWPKKTYGPVPAAGHRLAAAEDVLLGELHAVLPLADGVLVAAAGVELARLGNVGHQFLDVAGTHVLADHYHGPGRKGGKCN